MASLPPSALRADTSLSEGGKGRRIPTPVFALARNDRETGRRGDVGIAPYEIAGVRAGRDGERWGKMFTLAALTLGNYYCIIN